MQQSENATDYTALGIAWLLAYMANPLDFHMRRAVRSFYHASILRA